MNSIFTTSRELTGVITSMTQARPGKKWRVHFSATDWFADAEQAFDFKPGEVVRVIGQKTATTLLIEPV
ncbi:MAG: hypothetical protein KME07_08135 [Pegethrix bostrychoides GSE-TBD4-15B]|jgi:membrane protein implicated in regulation of membrane protease activity|uniref:NfeD-like C-terminal domain-containing protein n=1 Tax=Pegethrix bostrychoides GSE-TBD4-15B TaxID=2839662 RepID=A0A951P9Q4_9CYAN|nr:hypothetical protein [Pegethrix bostrychoides GSE-TBD4-15B]